LSEPESRPAEDSEPGSLSNFPIAVVCQTPFLTSSRHRAAYFESPSASLLDRPSPRSCKLDASSITFSSVGASRERTAVFAARHASRDAVSSLPASSARLDLSSSRSPVRLSSPRPESDDTTAAQVGFSRGTRAVRRSYPAPGRPDFAAGRSGAPVACDPNADGFVRPTRS
jgi:hypothetical protein